MNYPIFVSVIADLNQHKCLFDRIAIENPICVSVNPDLK